MDLGDYWENTMKVPIPLGGIAAKRTLRTPLVKQVSTLIKESLAYAFTGYPEVTGYVKDHSQTMSEQVMRQHIDLYVNNYSLQLGDDGKKAILELFNVYHSMQGNEKIITPDLFL